MNWDGAALRMWNRGRSLVIAGLAFPFVPAQYLPLAIGAGSYSIGGLRLSVDGETRPYTPTQ
jgi:hypothetical protein